MRKLTTEGFIARAKQTHGNKYDYSKTNYINKRTEVCIVCPIHGEFLQKAEVHYSCGCPACSNEKHRKNQRSNTGEFIVKAKQVHGDKYDYSKVEYKKSSEKVCIICPEHGEFWQTANNHLMGSDCPVCASFKSMKIKSKKEFVKMATEIHDNKYDYSKTKYVNSSTKVLIICPEHGDFWQKPINHLSGRGCKQCSLKSRDEKRLHEQRETFIAKAKELYADKYDYSKVVYTSSEKNVTIICPIHGEFEQQPYWHLKYGCMKCRASEKNGKKFLEEANARWNYKYDYSKMEYRNSRTPVCIICPTHGEFWQIPQNHIKHGCSQCNSIINLTFNNQSYGSYAKIALDYNVDPRIFYENIRKQYTIEEALGLVPAILTNGTRCKVNKQYTSTLYIHKKAFVDKNTGFIYFECTDDNGDCILSRQECVDRYVSENKISLNKH